MQLNVVYGGMHRSAHADRTSDACSVQPVESTTTMSTESGFLPGILDLLILKAISLGRLHGYGVMLRIRKISGGAFNLRQGSLYPALARLRHKGLVEAEWGATTKGRRARHYRLTRAGRRRLREEAAHWERRAAAMAAAIGATPDGS